MALYDNYFTNEDKPFAENLNDALLLSNVFDMTVDVEAPKMFSNSTWVSTTSPRKCGVSILTLKDGLPSGVSVGTDSSTGNSTLTGTGTVKLSWYPNFNSFGKFKSISWEADGDITVNLKTSNGTTIVSNISKGIIENQSSDLRTLQEIVIELVFSNATLKSLTVTMENKSQERYGATVGITDVTGLDDRLTVIESKNTQQDDRLTALEEVDDGIFFYHIYASDYNPSIDSSVTVYCKCNDVNGDNVVGKSLTLYKDGSSVSSATTQSNGVATWTVNCDDWGLQTFTVDKENIQINVKGFRSKNMWNGTLYYDNEKVEYVLDYHSSVTWQINNAWTDSGAFDVVPSNLRPKQYVYSSLNDTRMTVRVHYSTGKVQTVNSAQISNPYIQCVMTWFLP